jgi:hypothetical protein
LSTPGPLRTLVAGAFLLLCSGPAAEATTLVAADLAELSRSAQTIARGRVAAVEGRWRDDHRSIETLIILDVEASLKGTPGPTLRFVTPGGQLGRYRSIFFGAPVLAVGERVIVFLGARGPAIPCLLGLNQGLFRLVAARQGLEWTVIPPAPVAAAGPAQPIVRGDPGRRPLSLSAFESQVRALASGAGMPGSAAPRGGAPRRALAR